VDSNLVPYWKIPLPILYFSSENQKRIASIGTDVNAHVVQSMARFITGDLSIEGNWENYSSSLEKMGIKEYMEIYQKAYDVWNKN
jgi:putative aldouronate transport system substrate-binding protein